MMVISVKQNEKHNPPVPVEYIFLALRPKIDSPKTAQRKAFHRRFRVFPDGVLVLLGNGNGTSLLHGSGPIATLSRQPHELYLPYSWSPPQQLRNPVNIRPTYYHPIENLEVGYLSGIEEEEEVEEEEEERRKKNHPQEKIATVFKSEKKNQSQDVKIFTPPVEKEDKYESASEKSRVLKMVEKIKKCRCESMCRKMRKATKKLNKCSIM